MDSARIDYFHDFQSRYCASRNVEVYVPECYSVGKVHDVLIMHDGQNVFNAETSFAGVAWNAQQAYERIYQQGKTKPCIIVALWNTPQRMTEYMPAKPQRILESDSMDFNAGTELLSDKYLLFIIQELKPFLFEKYSVYPDFSRFYICGSSMGGLISAYSLSEYPEEFSGAACLSTHWPAANGIFVEHLREMFPRSGKHKLYFDFGTENIDQPYGAYQRRVDQIFFDKGYVEDRDYRSLCFQGAGHSESDWKQRLHVALDFLLFMDFQT